MEVKGDLHLILQNLICLDSDSATDFEIIMNFNFVFCVISSGTKYSVTTGSHKKQNLLSLYSTVWKSRIKVSSRWSHLRAIIENYHIFCWFPGMDWLLLNHFISAFFMRYFLFDWICVQIFFYKEPVIWDWGRRVMLFQHDWILTN